MKLFITKVIKEIDNFNFLLLFNNFKKTVDKNNHLGYYSYIGSEISVTSYYLLKKTGITILRANS